MLTNTNEILNSFGERIVEEVKRAISNKNLTGYGPSIASGKLLDSIRFEVSDNELRVLSKSYISFLQYGRGPSKSGVTGSGKTLKEVIRQWIDDKGITPDGKTSKDSLAYLIARKIHNEGNSIYRKFGGQSSGLLDDVFTDQLVIDIENSLILAYVGFIRSDIMRNVPNEMKAKS
jgi:hypothetical protein